MTDFPLHTIETAPEEAKPLLEASKRAYGSAPNLHAAMAEAPALLGAYQDVATRFTASSLSPTERTVVWMTLNAFHECHYCIPAHTAIAHSEKVSADIIQALRAQTPLADPKLEALRLFTRQLAETRGRVSEADQAAFLNAGFEKRHLGEVLVGVAHKVMSNYFNHVFDTPVDAAFARFIDDPLGTKQTA